jgi:AcrR family transcriptional regulator
MTTPRLEERPLRADAQRNLARILDAAREVFAEEGIEATVAEVAERAGVGTATIFRRFPTKDDLLAAVVEHSLEDIAQKGREALAGKNAMKGLDRLMRWGI